MNFFCHFGINQYKYRGNYARKHINEEGTRYNQIVERQISRAELRNVGGNARRSLKHGNHEKAEGLELYRKNSVLRHDMIIAGCSKMLEDEDECPIIQKILNSMDNKDEWTNIRSIWTMISSQKRPRKN